jgi:hypothetical protein
MKPKDIVSILFLDHSNNSTEPMECEVVGRVVEFNKLYVVLAWWNIVSECEEEREMNRETVTILISSILEVWEPTWKKKNGRNFR